jgi:hypothetical protein
MLRRLFPWVVGLVGVLFALAVLLPHILQRVEPDYPFQGIEIMGTDNETYYAARVREVTDGGWPVGNAYYDQKDVPPVQPAFPEGIIAVTGSVFGLDAVRSFVAAKAVLAFVLVVVMTGFLFTVTERRWIALLAVTGLLFAEAAFSAPWDLPKLLDPSFTYEFLRFARLTNPQWPTAIFFGVLWLMALWLQKRETWKMILAGVLTGTLLYAYVYAWSYVGVVIALLLVWFAWKKQKARAMDLLCFGIAFVVIGIPYLINVSHLVSHPWYADTAMRQGLVHKREMLFGLWALGFVPFSLILGRIWPRQLPLFLALSLGGIIVLNQQLVTGIFLVPHHYHWYFVQPLSCLSLILILSVIFTTYVRSVAARRMAWVLCLAVAIAFGFHQQQLAYGTQQTVWGERQELAPVLGAINASVAGESVIYASNETFLRELIPIYTSANVYANLAGHLFLTPMNRARDAYFFDKWLKGLSAQDAAKEFPTTLRSELSSALFAIYYRELLGQFTAIPDTLVEENIELYKAYLALPLQEKINRHRLDALVFTPDDMLTPEWESVMAKGRITYDADGYKLIQFTNALVPVPPAETR